MINLKKTKNHKKRKRMFHRLSSRVTFFTVVSIVFILTITCGVCINLLVGSMEDSVGQKMLDQQKQKSEYITAYINEYRDALNEKDLISTSAKFYKEVRSGVRIYK